jgi:hypothetical protein
MSALDTARGLWKWQWISRHPLLTIGVSLHLLLRTLFGVFWLAAGINKVRKDWLSSDILTEIFLDRLTELPPDSFAVLYLQSFAIPLVKLVAWVVTAIGGYYDASLIPFFLLNILFLTKPSGLWLGLDRLLARRFPGSRWFS